MQEESRYLVAPVLRRIWNYIDERKQPVNTLVVVDEAHTYACGKGNSPSMSSPGTPLREAPNSSRHLCQFPW